MNSNTPRRGRKRVTRSRFPKDVRKIRLRRISELEARSTNEVSNLTRQLTIAQTTLNAIREMTDRANSTQIADLRVRIRNWKIGLQIKPNFLAN